jgi:hypothetical protein
MRGIGNAPFTSGWAFHRQSAGLQVPSLWKETRFPKGIEGIWSNWWLEGAVYTFTAAGGAAASGDGTPAVSYVSVSSGGAVQGGQAALSGSYIVSASGGSAIGGDGAYEAEYLLAPDGGLALAGFAAVRAWALGTMRGNISAQPILKGRLSGQGLYQGRIEVQR